jgi:fucose permease
MISGHALIPVTIAAAFVFGMIYALPGTIRGSLAQALRMDEGRVRAMLAAHNVAVIPMVLLAGLLADKVGLRAMVIAGSILIALGLITLGTSRSYPGAFYSLFATSLGLAVLSVSAVLLMPKAFFDDDCAASVNLGMVFFGLGALVTPPLSDVLTRGIGLRQTLMLVGSLALLPAIAAALCSRRAFLAGSDLVATDVLQVVENPAIWLAGLTFTLYCVIEGAVSIWATAYFLEIGHSATRAVVLVAGFWLSIILGRLAAAFLQYRGVVPRGSEAWLIAILSVVAGVVLGNLAGTLHHTTARMGYLLAGACLGPIFPTLVGILFDNTETGRRGLAYGVMFAIGSAGSAVLAPAMGAYARRSSTRNALRFPMIIAFFLAASGLVLALTL